MRHRLPSAPHLAGSIQIPCSGRRFQTPDTINQKNEARLNLGPASSDHHDVGRSPQQVEEELLVLEAQAGRLESFAKLAARWERPVLTQARRLTDSDHEARDVAQETWLAAARSIRRLRDPARFAPWLMRILANKATDHIRRRRRERKNRESLPISLPAPSDTPDDTILRALRSLPADRQTLLLLHVVNEVPLATVAATLGIPEGTAKSRLHHTRKAIRALMKGETHE